MKKVYILGIISCFALSACSDEMQQHMADERKPRVVNLTPVSVTVSQYGNSMIATDPSPETVTLATQTCKSMGKTSAVHASFTDPDKDSAFDPEFMRNHQLFMCQ